MFERLFALHSFVLTFFCHGAGDIRLLFKLLLLFSVHGAGDIRLLFKLLFKFRNVLKHTERRSSLACNQNIKDDIPTALEVFLCFETERNDINSPRKHSRNARVISAEELGTMSKNNLRGITLDIGPILGIHSLTLIISCCSLMSVLMSLGSQRFYNYWECVLIISIK